MQTEKLQKIKRITDTFRNAFNEVLSNESEGIQMIIEKLYDTVNHLSIACENAAMMTISSSDVDIEEFKCNVDNSIEDALETIEAIPDILSDTPMRFELKMALTGTVFIIRHDLLNL